MSADSQDVDRLRALLLEYIEERETAEGTLHARETALQESEARYRALIQRAAYGIFRASLDGQFVDVNPALVHMLGYESPRALLATNMTRDLTYDPADAPNVIREALEGTGSGWSEVKWRRYDGAPILVRIAMQVVRDTQGNAVAVEGITEDITERARREELLRRSERMASLGHMLAGVAHELNNPLAAVSGFAQLLLKQDLPTDITAAVETMHHEAMRAAKIVRDLLTFSRRQEAERREFVDLNEIVRYIVDAQRYQIETRGVTVRLALTPNLPRVVAQASQLEQVVLNLVVNARQALEKQIDEASAQEVTSGMIHYPAIVVRTSTDDHSVTLEIADSGPGIPEEQRAKIWDPFWTTKGQGEGTGLGLSVVHGIVTNHSGTIDVDTEVGVGTRFTVTLPASRVPSASHTGATSASTALGTTPKKVAPDSTDLPTPLDILVVDDEMSILGFVQRYLTRRGHRVVTATTGEEAVQLATDKAFDVVICDLRMPGISGLEVIRRLRAVPTGRHTRVIVSSGDGTGQLATEESEREFAELGVVSVVEKPYEIDILRQAVEAPAESAVEHP